MPHGFLAGMIYPVFGKYEKAIEEAKKAIELDPDFAIGYISLAFSYLTSTAWRKPRTPFSEPPSANWKSLSFSFERYDIAFLKGDTGGNGTGSGAGPGKIRSGRLDLRPRGFCPGIFRSLAAGQEAVAACGGLWLGRRPSGKERLCMKPGQRCGKPFSGMRPRPKQSAAAALELSKDRDVEYGAAFALALVGGFLPGSNARRMIWKSASRRIRRSDSATCRRFAHFSR